MIDRRFLMIARLVVDDTEVDVGEEFACNICNLLMPRVVVNRVAVVLRVILAQLHVVDSNAVVSQSLTVHITDGFADLEELLV